MAAWAEKIYSYLPIFLQNVAASAQGYQQRRLRYGGRFREFSEWLEDSQWWSVEKIGGYQDEQLRDLIKHAYETVPYYRRCFEDLKLKPLDIKLVKDLSKLPVLTKEGVRNQFEELLSTQFRSKGLVPCHTSGTSGKSLRFFQEPSAIQFRWAVWWRHKRRFGVEFDSPYATFTGLTAVPLTQYHPPYWRENRPMHQTVFTMHHVVPSKVKDIVARLNRGGFEYYSGYPSILYALAVLIEEQGLEITAPPKVIFTGAENLYEDQRQTISKLFKAPVTDQYGFSESAGNASRCTEDCFHEDFEFGLLECGDAEPIDDKTWRGRIIGTGFSSYAMPFIRYEVGDVGIWRESTCSCGRKSKVLLRIEGRVEDFVITPEGSRILRFDYIFKDTNNIREAQVVQRELGRICLRIVRRSAYKAEDEIFLEEEIRRKVSPRLKVEFEYVKEIKREPNGKFRAVQSYLRKSLP